MSEYIFVTNIFEYSNIRIYSSHSALDTPNLAKINLFALITFRGSSSKKKTLYLLFKRFWLVGRRLFLVDNGEIVKVWLQPKVNTKAHHCAIFPYLPLSAPYFALYLVLNWINQNNVVVSLSQVAANSTDSTIGSTPLRQHSWDGSPAINFEPW